jgi:hypothetical protein
MLHRLDQVRQRRLRVAGDDEVDVGVALEVLVVRLDIEVGRADADELRFRLIVVSE